MIPTLAVFNSVDEIDLDQLPDRFVLKCNHDSGNVVICKDKLSFDLELAKQKLDDALKKDYYLKWREWPYKNVKKKVLAEKFMEASEVDDLIDYKMMTFSGKVKGCFTCTNRRSDNGLNVTVFDREWERMPFGRPNHPVDVNPIVTPQSYEEMVEIFLLSEDSSAIKSYTTGNKEFTIKSILSIRNPMNAFMLQKEKTGFLF